MYIQAYPQVDVDCYIYMEVPAGFHMVEDSLTCSHTAAWNTSSRNILKLHKNLYGLKQAGCNWFLKLQQGLLDCGFTQSKIDLCLFWKDDVSWSSCM